MGLAYFAAVLSMIGDWFRVISKKTKEEVCADYVCMYVLSCVTLEVTQVGNKNLSLEKQGGKNDLLIALCSVIGAHFHTNLYNMIYILGCCWFLEHSIT